MPPSLDSTASEVKAAASQNKNVTQEQPRRGPKEHFNGSRKIYLQSRLPAYIASKKGSRQKFWHALYSGWWERFPWKLGDDKEPPTNDPAEMTRLASIAPGKEAWKEQVETRLKRRLKNWFINRASAKMAATRNDSPWQQLLQRLHQIRNPRPRRRKAVHQYILDHAAEINAVVATRHTNGEKLDSCQLMNLRYEVAQSLLESKDSEFREGLEQKAAAQHEAAKEEWNLILEDISAAEDVSQARDTLFDAVHPLLRAIGSYAGCYVSLIAGNPGKSNDDGFFTAVHWWPGNRTSTVDWTGWDRDAFNTGVAGPFLKYAAHTDQVMQTAIKPSPTLPNSMTSVDINDPPSTDDHPSIRIGSATTVATRPLPAKTTVSVSVQGAKKRKYAAKPGPVYYFDDTGSEEDDSGNLSGDGSGDGSSSGDSLSDDDAPARPKRQRTSTVITRSSTRTSHQSASRGELTAALPVPASAARSFLAIPGDNSTNATGDSLTDTSTPPSPPDLSLANGSEGAMEVDDSLGCNTSHETSSKSSDNPPVAAEPTPNILRSANSIVPDSETKASAVMTTRVTASATAEPVAKMPSLTRSSTTSAITSRSPSPPASSIIIDVNSVPAFLRSHGTGKREVDIFGYLNEVKDHRFRRVLLHYIRVEAGDQSGASGTLSTSKRPVEISHWSTRARPAILPDFPKGKRTFSDFVDSASVWWGSIQPAWRSFKRGQVSREVGGEWDTLYAPRINGLLNVVILVYWWARILEERKPADGVRADYEQFADDVAWVFSNLSN